MSQNTIRTGRQIRQDFLDFFKAQGHTLVPSSSLMPDSPNLLFTNAGMNQFVPIFLGQHKCPYQPARAADTQKCIRAGGKHNDLEDVGLDTYHHTFFEMLGNWSFGDYFKQEAIEWAWELVTGVWKFPKNRLYATVYQPDPAKGDPSEFDHEAWSHWARLFTAAGLDPKVHIVPGNKKDNFWMMGDTGPCGPCSELHVDLTPAGDTQGALVNQGSPQCIEIWNLVFMQFNANPDGTFSPLPAKSVDTGMGFERVASIVQCTQNFTDFTGVISNYETDIFRPLFDRLEQMSGKRYGSTLPGTAGFQPASTNGNSGASGLEPAPSGLEGRAPSAEQIALDIAFRVIADHIRTLSFAIADGIQPGNTDRNYVLRRILRRAVRYGRTLGFHEPFFYKLVDVLADTMGDVFPEVRAKQKHVQEVIRVEEEAFNKTLDRGIELFNEEAERLGGWGAHAPSRAAADALAGSPGASDTAKAKYSRRRLPHFERPWAKYMVTFATIDHRSLTTDERKLALQSVLYAHTHRQYQLYAACVMPDHVHLLFEPQIKEQDQEGKPVFWSLTEILQGIKSASAHQINKASGAKGSVWEKESFDRLIRSDSDLEEKFHYICTNPWDSGVAPLTEDYPWLWIPDVVGEGANDSTRGRVRSPEPSAGAPTAAREGACAPQIAGDFAFKLYDTYGFPLDLTELMARERGLTVDVEGFNKLMDEQRARARAAQKKTVIELSQIETATPTAFVGYDQLETPAQVLEVVQLKDKTAVILDTSVCYAEMGGQVGDTGEIEHGSHRWRIANTQKSGNTWLHVLASEISNPESQIADTPAIGSEVTLSVDRARRAAIQRHHTATHLLHWALHEVVSQEAAQKGSFVGPEKLTFDFNGAPLTPPQLAAVERLVNERILENAPVSWTEVPFAEIKQHPRITQLFGEKYGDTVRVLQIGGQRAALDGFSMELCGGTHCRATGEIGMFRIVGENAIAAGVRRLEAIAGLEAWRRAGEEVALLKTVAERLATPIMDLDKKIENLLAHQKELEKQLLATRQKQAAELARGLALKAQTNAATAPSPMRYLVENLGAVDGDFALAVAEALKSEFKGVVVLGATGGGSVALLATVSSEFTARFQAGKLIQTLAPIVGGKGGGRPDFARGGGKDTAKLNEALAKARALLG